MKTLIKQAHVVLPDQVLQTSVLIDGTRIADIDPAMQIVADEVIDATGKYLIPGVIDDQVHFREPGLTDKEDLSAASRACAKGGVTTFLEMPNTHPTTTTVERLHEKLKLAAGKSLVNFGFYIGATPDNLAETQRAGRTPGIKIFLGSSTGELLVDDQASLERIFGETTLPIAAHCEDEATIRANRARFVDTHNVADHSRVRDEQAAIVATRRAVDLAERHRHRFHVLHVSTAAEVPLIASHRPFVTAEACPHHLLFNIDDYERLGTLVQMNPSLKTAADNEGLWQALLAGTIQVVATDHAPHTRAEKQQDYPQSPSGLPAVENSLALMLDQVNRGRCSISQVVHWMCEAPALVWDLVNKGRIEVGFDADLALVDLELNAQVLDSLQITKCGWSPWHGEWLRGWPIRTWVRGHAVFQSGKFDTRRMGTEARFDHARGGYWAAYPEGRQFDSVN